MFTFRSPTVAKNTRGAKNPAMALTPMIRTRFFDFWGLSTHLVLHL
jgi:hypothetical protein